MSITSTQTLFDNLPYQLTHRIQLTACHLELNDRYDEIIHKIRFNKCTQEIREGSIQYNELIFAARSLWRVVYTRLLHGLDDAHFNNMQAWNMLRYIRSKLGLAYGCGPQLDEYRCIMDYLDNVAVGRTPMTRAGLIWSGVKGQSIPGDFIRIAELMNQFYVGVPFHIIDADYTSDEEDDVPEPCKELTDAEIYQFLHIHRVGFHI